MIGLDNEKIVHVPFNKAVKLNHTIDNNLLEIQNLLNI
jgi:6-phosphofructokinase 1